MNSRQIEAYLAVIDDGELSEDDLEESDAEDHEVFNENREYLHHDLESLVEDEQDDCGDDPLMAEDPPLINEPSIGAVPQISFPSTSQASRRATMKGLVWKVKNLVLNSDQTAFLGSTTYPPELRDQTAAGTPYSIFNYFLTSEILEKIVEESNLYSVQKNVTKPLNLTETELRKFIAILIFMSVIKYPNVRLYWSNTVCRF